MAFFKKTNDPQTLTQHGGEVSQRRGEPEKELGQGGHRLKKNRQSERPFPVPLAAWLAETGEFGTSVYPISR
jgi:hypothetical protein